MASPREQDDRPPDSGSERSERPTEVQQSTTDLLHGRNRDMDRESSPLDRMTSALSQSQSPDVREAFEAIREQSDRLKDSVKEGSLAQDYLKCGDPDMRMVIREKLNTDARSTDPERSADAVANLRTINLAETLTKMTETLSGNDEQQRADRYDAMRQLYGLRRNEPGDEGPAGKVLEAITAIGKEPLSSEVSAAIMDKEWEQFILKDESKALLKTMLEGNPNESQQAAGKLDLHNKAQLDQGNDDINRFLKDLEREGRITWNPTDGKFTPVPGLPKEPLDVEDWMNRRNPAARNARLDESPIEREIRALFPDQDFDDIVAGITPEVEVRPLPGSSTSDEIQTATPYELEVGAAKPPSPAKNSAVEKGSPAEKASVTEKPPEKLSSHELQKAFMQADSTGKTSADASERKIGQMSIVAHAGRQAHLNKDGRQFELDTKGRKTGLEGVPGVTGKDGGWLSFTAEPIYDSESKSWKLQILGPDGKPSATIDEKGNVEVFKPKTNLTNGQKVGYEYDKDGVSAVTDGSGAKLQREPGSKDEWTLDRGNGPEKLNGKVTSKADGTFVFEGRDSKGEAIKIEQQIDGKVVETRGNTITESTRGADGSTVKVVLQQDGEKQTPQEITKLDSKGNPVYSFKAVPGSPDSWQSDEKGTIAGRPSISNKGELSFTQEIALPDGKSKIITRDESGNATSITEPFGKGEAAVTWKKAGDSDWWMSSDGKAIFGKVEKNELTEKPPTNKEEQRRSLEALVKENIKDPRRQQAFLDHINKAEERAKEEGLSDKQLASSFHDLGRLIATPDNKDIPVGREDRIKIAEQAIQQMAQPDTIDQGHHMTCNVTTIENLLYTKQPELAMKLVADVALTGSFKTASGRVVSIQRDQLQPDKEAAVHPREDGARSHASQIFQMTAVNVYHSAHPHPDRKDVTVRYVQLPGKAGSRLDTAERLELIDKDGKHAGFYKDKKGNEIASPYLQISHMSEVFNELGGNKMDVFCVERWTNPYSPKNAPEGKANEHYRTGLKTEKDNPELLAVDTPENLAKTIEKLQKEGKLPVIIGVHGNVYPFGDERYGDNHAAHVVVVRGIVPGNPPKLLLDNQWGSWRDKAVDVNLFYKSMIKREDKKY